jgi:hypothetical protein
VERGTQNQGRVMQAARRILTTSGLPFSSRFPDTPETEPRLRLVDQRSDLLTAEQVAVRLNVKPRWVHQRQRLLPFRIELSPRKIRYSATGLKKYMAGTLPGVKPEPPRGALVRCTNCLEDKPRRCMYRGCSRRLKGQCRICAKLDAVIGIMVNT